MSDQSLSPAPASPDGPRERPPVGNSRYIPLMLMTAALILVFITGVVSRRAVDDGRAIELGVTQTVQAVIEAATGTAQAIGSQTPRPTVTATP